jgi:hypothetical protein
MNNQNFVMSRILSVTLLLSTIPAGFLALAAPDAFGQIMFASNDKNKEDSTLGTTNNNSITRDYNIVAIGTTTGTNESSAATSSNRNQIIPRLTVVDVINSTYITPKDVDESESERRISRAIRDRINDVAHTVVMSNATIISTATITNSFLDESTTVNNYTRLLEIIPDQVEVTLAGIRATSQPANPTIEIQTDIGMTCNANNTTLADCNINIRILPFLSNITTEESPEMNMTTTTVTNATTTADINATAVTEEEQGEEEEEQQQQTTTPALVL